MDKRILNVLGVAGALALLLAAFAALSYSSAFEKSIQPSSFRSFSVSGEAKVVAVPDVATFSFTVLTEGGVDISALQTQNTEKVNKAIDFVKSKGIDPKDIQTSSYNLTPRYTYFQCGITTPSVYGAEKLGALVAPNIQACPPPKITGYSISQTVEIKARDFSKVGDILSGVVSNGANTVSSLSFTIDDPAKIQQEAREKAIVKAKEKAQQIARVSGFRVGRLLGIDENGYQPYANYMMDSRKSAALGMGGADAAAAPAIEPGSQNITVTVTMRYEIE